MTEQPPFLTPPMEPTGASGTNDTTVVPFRNSRAVSSDIAVARDTKLREMSIETEKILRDAAEIYKLLLKGSETLVDHMGEPVEIPLTRERIAALNSAKDICFKLLAKTMPDIKQIVVSDETAGETPFNFEMILQDILK